MIGFGQVNVEDGMDYRFFRLELKSGGELEKGGISVMGKTTKFVVGMLVVVLLGVILIAKGLESNMHKLQTMELTDVDLEGIADGTYVGSYELFPVSVVVEVAVKNHELTGIKLVEHRNGRGKAGEAVVDRVLKAQALQIDAVSGATYSSLVILKAIDNALAEAQR